MHTVVGVAIVQGGASCSDCEHVILSVPVCIAGCILNKYLREWLCQENDIVEHDALYNN